MSWQLSSLRWPPVDGEPEPHHEAEAGSLSPDLSGSPRDTSAAEHRVLWEPSQQFWSQTLCVFGLACSESSGIMSRRPKALREMGILYLMEPRARNLGAWRSLDVCPVQPPMAHHMVSGKHTSTDKECSASPLLSHSSHPIPSHPEASWPSEHSPFNSTKSNKRVLSVHSEPGTMLSSGDVAVNSQDTYLPVSQMSPSASSSLLRLCCYLRTGIVTTGSSLLCCRLSILCPMLRSCSSLSVCSWHLHLEGNTYTGLGCKGCYWTL